ncbi:MAG: GspE/PulE family protein [bacterium]
MDQKIDINVLFQKTIEQLFIALTGVSSYPPDHSIPLQLTEKSYQMFTEVFKSKPVFTTTVIGETFLVNDTPIRGKDGVTSKFASYLNKRDLDSLTFTDKLSSNEFTVFLRTLSEKPEIIKKNGGIATVLTKNGVKNVTVNDIKYGRIKGNGAYHENIINIDAHENLCLGTEEIKSNIKEEIKSNIKELQRIAEKLVKKEGTDQNQFKKILEQTLSTYNSEKLSSIADEIGEFDSNKNDLMNDLTDEFFYDSIAEDVSNDYLKDSPHDKEFIQRLLPTEDEQKKFFPYLQKKVKEKYGESPDTILNEEEFLRRIANHNKAETASIPMGGNHKEEALQKTKGKLIDLLTHKKTRDAYRLIKDFAERLDDESDEIRQGVALGLRDLISTLIQFNQIKSNDKELPNLLIDKLKQEKHIDTYLILADNYELICVHQNKKDAYYIDDTLGSRLYQAKKLNKMQIQQLLIKRRRNNRSLQYNFGALDFAHESILIPFLAEQYKGFSVINLSDIPKIPSKTLNMIPLKFIKHHLVLPFKVKDRKLFTAMDNPMNMDMINELQFVAGCSIVPCVAGEYYLINAIENYYHTTIAGSEVEEALEEITSEEELEYIEEKEDEHSKLNDIEEGTEGPVVKLVNLILKDAITKKASDIHIEPYENEFRIRYRVDGSLIPVMNPPTKYKNGVTSRIKIMSRLDIAERRLPQDGRFKIKLDNKYLDFRVSTFPGNFGEKVVLRILDKSTLDTKIDKLGMREGDLKILITSIHKSKGMILVTGPTGSGKSTTLYSVIQELNNCSRNIMTAEDPIEYNMPGVNQFQMNPKIKLNFAVALRSFLRQDPDIIMMGEIRDLETAEMAVKAALTGHLVLSTLHTNSAAETITRLNDIGIGSFLIASSVNLIIAQRLMRIICPNCKEETIPNDFQLEYFMRKGIDASKTTFFRGDGCIECNDTGYKGREAIFEILPLQHEIREMIIRDQPAYKIKEKASILGFQSLHEKGFAKVKEGRTTLDEWFRVVL